MANPVVPAGFEQGQKPADIGMNISLGIFQRIPHPGLGGEVNDNIRPFHPDKAFDIFPVGDILLIKSKPLAGFEVSQPILFKCDGHSNR